MSISLSKIKQQNSVIDELRIHSFDMDIYLAEVKIANTIQMLCDDGGQLIKFRSTLAAKKPFKGLSIDNVFLVQNSVYNEMIGLEEKSVEPMKIPLSHPDDDPS